MKRLNKSGLASTTVQARWLDDGHNVGVYFIILFLYMFSIFNKKLKFFKSIVLSFSLFPHSWFSFLLTLWNHTLWPHATENKISLFSEMESSATYKQSFFKFFYVITLILKVPILFLCHFLSFPALLILQMMVT